MLGVTNVYSTHILVIIELSIIMSLMEYETNHVQKVSMVMPHIQAQAYE